MAKVESVNVGRAQNLPNAGELTGIYKTPVTGAVEIGGESVAGDFVADAYHHGGPDQAAYVYFADDYAWWETALGRKLQPGTFGENVTISGLASADIAVGDRLTIGKAILEVTAPRIPCNTLARRMEDPGFVRAFRDSERPGAYCRVIVPGSVAAGTPVTHQPFQGKRIGVVGMFRDTFAAKKLDASRIREVLAAPIAVRERRNWTAFLATAEAKA